jgi:hypothetical protein
MGGDGGCGGKGAGGWGVTVISEMTVTCVTCGGRIYALAGDIMPRGRVRGGGLGGLGWGGWRGLRRAVGSSELTLRGYERILKPYGWDELHLDFNHTSYILLVCHF